MADDIPFFSADALPERDANLVAVVGGKPHFIGQWQEAWKGHEKFGAMASVWSQMVGVCTSHRERELDAIKPANRNRPPEGPSEMSARLRGIAANLKSAALAETRVKEARAWFQAQTDALPQLRPNPGDVGAALVRDRIRTRLEKSDPAALSAALADPSDQVLLAVLEDGTFPLSDATRERLTRLAIERANDPAKLEQLRAINEAIGVAENSVRAATAALNDQLSPTDQRELVHIMGESAA